MSSLNSLRLIEANTDRVRKNVPLHYTPTQINKLNAIDIYALEAIHVIESEIYPK